MTIRDEQAPPRRWRTALAVVPVATVAWLSVGTGVALAAPNGTANANAGNATSGNGGVGNGNGNGNAKHQDPVTTPADPGTSSGSTDSSAPAAGAAPSSSGTAGTSGSVTQPQPISKADSNSGGANGQCPGGPYCSTRDGSPSGNGNGKGKAVGKPCAGCVGKADNKNPKGQNPNGSDHNKGYECDGNNGIGKTNPAHTGCTSTPPPPPPTCEPPNVLVNGVCGPVTEGCPDGEHLSNGTCVPNPDCVPSAANNNCQPTTPCVAPAHAGPDGTCVLGEKHTRKPTGNPAKTPAKTPGTTVLGEKVTRLPFTGVEAAWLAEGGLGAVALGTLLIVTGGRRRRRQV